jgi:hypothetical protein
MLKKLISLLLIVGLLTSCQVEISPWFEWQSARIQLDGFGESQKGYTVHVQMTHSSGQQLADQQTVIGQSVEFLFTNIAVGTWDVLVSIRNNSQIVAEGSGQLYVSPNTDNFLSIPIKISPDTGNAVITVTFSPEEPTQPSDKIGVFIGVSDYDNPDNDLPYTRNDARELEYTFSQIGLEHSQIITPYVLESAASEAILETKQFAGFDSLFVFQYSGHGGYSFEYDYSFLCLSNYDGMEVTTRITVKELRRWLDAIPGVKLVLIDACRAGNFIDFPPDSSRNFGESFLSEFLNPRYDYEDSNTDYLIMVASTKGSSSWESSELENGVFSFFVSDGLGNTGYDNPLGTFDYSYDADLNENRQITFIELFEYVDAQVNLLMGDQQTTLYSAFDKNYIICEY